MRSWSAAVATAFHASDFSGGPTSTLGWTPGGSFGFVAHPASSAKARSAPARTNLRASFETEIMDLPLLRPDNWHPAAQVSTNAAFIMIFHRTLGAARRTRDEHAIEDKDHRGCAVRQSSARRICARPRRLRPVGRPADLFRGDPGGSAGRYRRAPRALVPALPRDPAVAWRRSLE